MRRLEILIIVAMWVFYFAALSAARYAEDSEQFIRMLPPRGVVVACGMLVTLGIGRAFETLELESLAARIATVIGAATLGCAIHTFVNYLVFYQIWRLSTTSSFLLSDQAAAIVDWFWLYLGLAATLMTLRYGADLAQRDIRLARLDALTRTAELRALRYQLNPHFLFNALNSIAALIGQSKTAPAEAMVVNLSDFLRASLSKDLADHIALSEEVELQKLYLEVEAERFPDRLRFEADVPPHLSTAQVPSLLLQPLVENAIKYGVAKSTSCVTVTLSAARQGDRLVIVVSDNGGDAEMGSGQGEGIGLRNVRERLAARFGDAATFEAGPRSGGGFANRLSIPLRMDASDAA